MGIPLYLALHFCTFVAFTGLRLILPLYALSLGAEAYVVGMLAGLTWFFPLLLSWPVGRFADRHGAQWLLLIGVISAMAAFLVPYFFHTLPALYAAALLIGISVAFGNGIQQSLIGQASTPETRTRNFSNLALVGGGTNLLGPLAAGFAIDHGGHAMACLYLLGVPVVAAILILARHRVFPPPRPRAAMSRKGESLVSADVMRVLIISALVQVGIDMFQFFLPVYGHSIGMSASAIGTTVGAMAVSSMLIRIVLPRLIGRFGEGRLLGASFLIQALCFVLVPLANAPLMMFTCFLFGFAQGCAGPISILLMMNAAPSERISEAVGMRLTAAHLVKLVGPTFFGAVGSVFGLPAVFGMNALLMIYGGALTRSRPSPP